MPYSEQSSRESSPFAPLPGRGRQVSVTGRHTVHIRPADYAIGASRTPAASAWPCQRSSWSGMRKPTAPPLWDDFDRPLLPARVAHHPKSNVQAALLTARQVQAKRHRRCVLDLERGSLARRFLAGRIAPCSHNNPDRHAPLPVSSESTTSDLWVRRTWAVAGSPSTKPSST